MTKRKQKLTCKACRMASLLRKRLTSPIVRHELALGAIVVGIESAWHALMSLDVLGGLAKLAVVIMAIMVGFAEGE